MERKHKRLATPWAAGVAGMVFAILTATAIVLVRIAVPSGVSAAEVTVDAGQRSAVRTALELIPFAGIAFLWFMGALREQMGEREDKFVSTVFLGSGLVFVATLFGAAAAAWSVLDEGGQGSSFGRDVAYALLTTYAMRMAAVFVITASTIGHRLGVLPRPLTAVGYLAGLTLLVVGANVPWSELVFPAWVFVLSLNNLWGRHPPASRSAVST
ncbi:hypothetical protein [Streptomyces sp. NPDC058579]|uniref:hypothetical protein n=1 Tax=Streptomyces sp. NPDC058579 TaxID=3346548 RepID=UPI00364AB9BA